MFSSVNDESKKEEKNHKRINYAQNVEEVSSTCDTNGTKAYFICSECGKRFIGEGENQKEVTSDDEFFLPSGHSFGEWIDEVPSSKDQEGTKGHKDCELCHKHFDGNNQEILDLTIPKRIEAQSAKLPSGAIIGITLGSIFVSETVVFTLI